ncbi:hypothetical protein WH47_05257 [Habropoda laboriosa]|uniref:Uncharacterized protein n=1 Tax=Habropoda laboriosa TaxID=597456 RepID=A0A0L7QVG6_9HYME|nr:hypothetical protein WH47_05257 [Habropoda laboriosa]
MRDPRSNRGESHRSRFIVTTLCYLLLDQLTIAQLEFEFDTRNPLYDRSPQTRTREIRGLIKFPPVFPSRHDVTAKRAHYPRIPRWRNREITIPSLVRDNLIDIERTSKDTSTGTGLRMLD